MKIGMHGICVDITEKKTVLQYLEFQFLILNEHIWFTDRMFHFIQTSHQINMILILLHEESNLFHTSSGCFLWITLSSHLSGSIASISCVLPSEYVGPKGRVVVSLRMGWRVGAYVITGLAFGIREWRHLAFACGLFFLPLFPVACL